VHAERRAAFERRPVVRAADALLVQSMPGLVHRAEQQRQRFALDPSCRDANIVGADGRGKRVDRLILPPARPVEAERADHLDGEVPHLLLAECRTEEPGVYLRAFGERPDQFDLPGAQHVEDLPHVGGGHPRLELVEQDVVRMGGGWKECDVLPFQLEHLFEMRLKHRKAGGSPRLNPGVLRRRDDPGQFPDELRRHVSRLLEVTDGDCHEARVVRGWILRAEPVLRRLERRTDGVGRELLVRHAAQGAGHLAVHWRRGLRHVDALIPLDEVGGVPDVGDLGQHFPELCKLVIHPQRA
jgi:hypothetical protein